jgi:hypothetical protein
MCTVVFDLDTALPWKFFYPKGMTVKRERNKVIHDFMIFGFNFLCK